MENREKLDIKQAAERLGVSEKTIRRHIKSGTIAAEKRSNVYFFRPEDLDAFASLDRASRRRSADEAAKGFEVSKLEGRIAELESRIEQMAAAAGRPAAESEEDGADLECENGDAEEIKGCDAEESNLTAVQLHDKIRRLRRAVASNERGLALLRERLEKKSEEALAHRRELAFVKEQLEEANRINRQLTETLQERRGWNPFRRGKSPTAESGQ